MACQIAGRLSNQLHSNVMPAKPSVSAKTHSKIQRHIPWHPWYLCSIIHIFAWFIKFIEIGHSRIAVVFSWPDFWPLGVGDVICQHMLGCIPSQNKENRMIWQCSEKAYSPPKTKIESTHEGDSMINDAQLLMLQNTSKSVSLIRK